jgi:hypothetical protein
MESRSLWKAGRGNRSGLVSLYSALRADSLLELVPSILAKMSNIHLTSILMSVG